MAQDEINHRFRVLRRQWKMSFPFSDDDSDLAAEFLVSLLHYASLTVEPWIEATAIVKDRDPSPGQRSQVIERRRLRHETVHRRIARVNTGNLIRIRNRPGIHLAPFRSGGLHGRHLRKTVIDHRLVGFIPLLLHLAGLRGDRRCHDVVTLRKKCQVHG